ncbi:MAG TPA: DUF6655 family protein [Isosphaeraceae bacterium]|nr:DUF6655 family protein [Isosphaeraceae bacterium]
MRIELERRDLKRIGWLGLLAAATLSAGEGCSSMKVTGTARSGTEQLLLTGTWDRALACVDFRALAGAPVFLNTSYLPETDKGWLTMSLRRAMAAQGVLLKDDQEDAAVVVEAALGAYGTDEQDCQVGLPSLASSSALINPLMGAAAAASSAGGPSMSMTRTNRQDAVVKLALFGYDAHTGAEVWESPIIYKASGNRDHYNFGIGPNRRSTYPEVEEYPEAAMPPRWWER